MEQASCNTNEVFYEASHQGHSLRLRVTRSEVSSLVDGVRVKETIFFSPDHSSHLTYALACDFAVASPQAQYAGREILVVLPRDQTLAWAATDQVGIYATVDLGVQGTLNLFVEKDFACMDLHDTDSLDTYPHPKAKVDC